MQRSRCQDREEQTSRLRWGLVTGTERKDCILGNWGEVRMCGRIMEFDTYKMPSATMPDTVPLNIKLASFSHENHHKAHVL